ncbi:Rrf2 family transcriptional regulator [Sulfitobacter sp. SK012]|uniref:Rrf2 family transcriptional regulator n=1 Tax=Sulfitobacter sp. SK012 TaxID=1389005 RepID=UPI000E0A4CBD|nr:Rrf2 family transcriptional regulator [Sulfitobacter sp. SK012]AXI46505.1 Rrf2 family transcriptional regulator [Sulfitobacter sp. SK012]
MRLTTFTDFGLRALMRIASDPDRAWSTTAIADEFGISRHHLTKVIAVLANEGILKTRRGGGGGAMLARPADRIRVGDLVRLLEKDQALVECYKGSGNACTITPVCKLKGFLGAAETAFLTSLDAYTLADCALPAQIPDFISEAAQ